MKDRFGREIEYMRISVTDRCNLRCRYCMPTETSFIPHEDILRYEEILRVCRQAASLGIHKFKITGGEPLVRRGCLDFMRQLKEMPGTTQVTLTTNGILLEDYAAELRDLGINGINVSLDTMKPERFFSITQREGLEKVLRGIEKAYELGIHVKLNCVPMHGVNDDELVDFIEISRDRKIDVRFIEMMPIGFGKEVRGVSADELQKLMKERYPQGEAVTRRLGNGPARYYHPKDFAGSIGFIEAIHGKFCHNCNRIRLTSEGFLKTCLYYNHGTDLRQILRGGQSDETLREALEQTIFQKPREHHFGELCHLSDEETRKMSQIGG